MLLRVQVYLGLCTCICKPRIQCVLSNSSVCSNTSLVRLTASQCCLLNTVVIFEAAGLGSCLIKCLSTFVGEFQAVPTISSLLTQSEHIWHYAGMALETAFLDIELGSVSQWDHTHQHVHHPVVITTLLHEHSWDGPRPTSKFSLQLYLDYIPVKFRDCILYDRGTIVLSKWTHTRQPYKYLQKKVQTAPSGVTRTAFFHDDT